MILLHSSCADYHDSLVYPLHSSLLPLWHWMPPTLSSHFITHHHHSAAYSPFGSATASRTSPSTMLIGVLAAIAMVFIFIAAALVLFLRSWDSMLCCKRRRQGQAAKTASRRRHVGGVAIELREPRYPPPAYKGYEKDWRYGVARLEGS